MTTINFSPLWRVYPYEHCSRFGMVCGILDDDEDTAAAFPVVYSSSRAKTTDWRFLFCTCCQHFLGRAFS
jgi:hypothetical protein